MLGPYIHACHACIELSAFVTCNLQQAERTDLHECSHMADTTLFVECVYIFSSSIQFAYRMSVYDALRIINDSTTGNRALYDPVTVCKIEQTLFICCNAIASVYAILVQCCNCFSAHLVKFDDLREYNMAAYYTCHYLVSFMNALEKVIIKSCLHF